MSLRSKPSGHATPVAPDKRDPGRKQDSPRDVQPAYFEDDDQFAVTQPLPDVDLERTIKMTIGSANSTPSMALTLDDAATGYDPYNSGQIPKRHSRPPRRTVRRREIAVKSGDPGSPEGETEP